MPDAKKLFETLVREHAEMLTVYLTSALGNRHDADDLFQETMIIAWKRLDDFDPTRPFGPWLRGIAKRLVLAKARQRQQLTLTPRLLEYLDSRVEQLAGRPGDTWQEKIEILRECVAALPEEYRRAVGLRYFQRQAIQQVSTKLGLSVSAVKKRLQRARAQVLDCVDAKLMAQEFSR